LDKQVLKILFEGDCFHPEESAYAHARGALALGPWLPEEVKALGVQVTQGGVIRDFAFLNLSLRILMRYFLRNG